MSDFNQKNSRELQLEQAQLALMTLVHRQHRLKIKRESKAREIGEAKDDIVQEVMAVQNMSLDIKNLEQLITEAELRLEELIKGYC